MPFPNLKDDRSRQMLILSAGTFCIFLAMLSLIPLLPVISDELLISRSNLGWVAGVFMIFMAFLQIPCGLVSDRFGRRLLIFCGIFIFSIGVLMLSISSSFLLLLVSRAVSGIGAAVFFQTSFTMVGDMYDLHRRGKGMGILAFATGLGTVSGYVAGGFLGEHYGWRWVFMILAMFSFFISFVSLLLHETRQRDVGDQCTGNLLFLSLDLFRTRTIVLSTFIGMFCNMASIGSSYMLPFFALDAGIPTSITGLLFVPFAVTSSLGASASGWVSDIVGRKKPLILVTSISGAALVTLSQIPAGILSIAIIFAFVGLCFGPVVTLSSTILVDEVVRTDSRILGTTMGTFNMVRWSGAALGPVFGGMLLDIYGARVGFAVLSSLILAATFFSVGLSEPLHK